MLLEVEFGVTSCGALSRKLQQPRSPSARTLPLPGLGFHSSTPQGKNRTPSASLREQAGVPSPRRRRVLLVGWLERWVRRLPVRPSPRDGLPCFPRMLTNLKQISSLDSNIHYSCCSLAAKPACDRGVPRLPRGGTRGEAGRPARILRF
jgi:hypothetical protein